MNSSDDSLFYLGLYQAIGLKCLERWSSYLLKGRVELLHGAEGFSEFRAHVGHSVRKGRQHLFFALSYNLLFGEGVSGPATYCLETQHVLAPKVRDRAVEQSRAPCSLPERGKD